MKPIRYRVVEVTPTKHPIHRTTLVCRAQHYVELPQAPSEVVDARAYDELRGELEALRAEVKIRECGPEGGE